MAQVVDVMESEIAALVSRLNRRIYRTKEGFQAAKIYPIPRGGIPVAYRLLLHDTYTIVETPEEADIFVDDLVDSGATRKRYSQAYPGTPFFEMIDKSESNYAGTWLTFPWERGEAADDESFTDNITRTLQYIGDDPTRGGLLETPARVAKAYKEIYSGYGMNAADVLKVFEDGAGNYNEMVVVNDIPFYSACEHHMEAVFGVASIAYIPNGSIVGLSKLSRVLDVFARRLQVQERLTVQIAEALEENLKPLGVGVLIRARHLCMERRGVCKQGHHTVTCALRGVLREDSDARAEFLKLTDTRPTI